MPDRNSLVSMLWLASALILMGSAPGVPIRASGYLAVASSATDDRVAFTLAQDRSPSYLTAAKATETVLQVSALASESDEQERADAPDAARVCFLIHWSYRKITGLHSIAPRSLPSLYPLRC